MFKRLIIAVLGFSMALWGAKPSVAETVVEKVARTGILTVGARFDLVPYSYVNDKGELDGFSLNVVNLIREELEKQLGRNITLQIIETNDVAESIPMLKMGEIDIACNTVFTWERDEHVDFSLSYSISGVRLLVPKASNLGTPESLANKKVAVMANSNTANLMKLTQPKIQLVEVKTVEEGVQALKSGKVDAVAGDTVILDGLRQQIAPNDYKLSPEQPYARFGVACMVPENNSTFLNIANHTIVKFMQGYLIGAKSPTEMVNRWIGPEGVVNVISPEQVRQFFEYTIMTREQIPFSEEKSQ